MDRGVAVTPSALLRRLYDARVHLWAHDGGLRFRAPPDVDADLLERARWGRAGLLRLLAGDGGEAPLSCEQERVWLFEQLAPASRAYVVPAAAWIDGPLDPDELARRVRRVARRHAVLRSEFVQRDGIGVQRPAARVPELRVVDLRRRPGPLRAAEALDVARASLDPPLDLPRGDVWRPLLVRVGDERALLALPCHHLAADAVTIGSMLDLILDPAAAEAGDDVPQYAHYAVASRSGGGPRAQALEFWKARLEGAPSGCTIPTDQPRPSRPSLRGAHRTRALRAGLSKEVDSCARALGVRPFTVASAALHVLLWHYTGQRDLVVGYPVSTRPPEFAGLPGFFAQTLAQRLRLDPRAPAATAIKALARDIDAGLEHADLGVEAALDTMSPASGPGLPFNVLIGYPGPSLAPRRYGDVTATPTLFDHGGAKLDLELYLCEDGRDLTAVLRYDTALYAEATAEALLGHYEACLGAIASGPGRRLGELTPVDAAERRQLVEELNATAVPHPRELLHDPIVREARRRPGRVAVVDGDRRLTYGELLARAEALAWELVRAGVTPDTVVGVCAERSAETVVGLLAILLAGGAYLPLDPELPDDRLAYMVAQAGVTVALSSEDHRDRAITAGATVLVTLDDAARPAPPDDAWRPAAHPASLAYVLFTSGSTGRPKGVMSTHEGIVNRLHWMQRRFRLEPDEAVLHKTPATFDVSVWELFWPLWIGARLVLAGPGSQRDPEAIAATIRSESVSLLHFVPSMLRASLRAGALDALPSLRAVVCSGEALDAALVGEFGQACQAELHNLYGPTEAAIDVTHAACTPARPGGRVPIGRPVDNTRVYVLDEWLRPAPRGGVGQIFLAGVQLARGYAGRADLTAAVFVPDPFRAGERMYATGDLGRVSPAGEIEFWGRADRQVKIRGQRIELGEIEAVMLEHPAVEAAAVVVDAEREKLLGYVEHAGGDDLAGVEEHLRGRLPAFMVPDRLVTVIEMPTTSSGKVDRRALPEPPVAPARPGGRAATGPEQAVAEAWGQVLGLDDVDLHQSFHALGGNSIASISVVALLRRRGYGTTVADVFRAASGRALAAGLRPAEEPLAEPDPFGLVRHEDRAGIPDGVEDAFPLSAQLSALVMHSEREHYLVYTTSVRLDGPWDEQAFRRACGRVLAAHAYLRSAVDLTTYSEPLQLVHRRVDAPLEVSDLRALDPSGRERTIELWLAAERHRAFRWDAAPLVRLTVHRETDRTFLVTFSEPFLDGWSATRTIVDLLEAYERELGGRADGWEPVPGPSYGTFVAAERAAASDARVRAFWQDALTGTEWSRLGWPPGVGDDPEDGQRRVELRLAPSVPVRLPAIAREGGVPLKSLCLAVHLVVVGRLTGTTTVATALMANGRPEVSGATNAVGLFLNANVLRVDTRDCSWTDLARRAFEAEAATLPHRRYPYSSVVADLGGNRLSDAILNFTDFSPYAGLAASGTVTLRDVIAGDQTYFPLTVHCRVDPVTRGLRVALEFAGGVFDRWQVEQIGELYTSAFALLADDPGAALDALALQVPRERRVYATALRGPGAALPSPTLDGRFAETASAHAGVTAIVEGDRRWSFGALAALVEELAAALAGSGAQRVGVRLPRSVDSIVAFLAALRCGVPFVPLDPALPPARLADLARRARIDAVVTRDGVVPSGYEGAVIDVSPSPGPDPAALPRQAEDPERVAFVLFTSGSSGEPKGVVVGHRAFLNRLGWYWRRFPFLPDDVVCHKGPLSFVDSVMECFAGLLAGVPTVVVPDADARDPERLLGVVAAGRVTRLTLVPSFVRALLGAGGSGFRLPASLRVLQLSGEPLPADLAADLRRRHPDLTIVNLYGSTETGADATAYVLGPAWATGRRTVPIGTPIDNMAATVLDPLGRLAPVGTVGELVLAGAGLFHGYLDERATAFQGVVDGAGRSFATGDLVRCGPDGLLEHVGRRDRMIKVRGVRIEPAELEGLLTADPEVSQVWVSLRTRGEDTLLVAHVHPVTGGRPDPAGLRARLARRLPQAMMPDLLVVVDEVPRTATGKVDVARLPLDEARSDDRPPSAGTERAIAALWQDVLDVTGVTAGRSFFDCGGDSLRAFRLALLLRRRLGVRFGVTDVFDHPTLELQARRVEALRERAGEDRSV
jgi:amino acid adenylation domain-containing protein